MAGTWLVASSAMGGSVKSVSSAYQARKMVFTAKLDGKLYFVGINPEINSIVKIPAICGPHSYQNDNGIYYGVEKKGPNLAKIDFRNPRDVRMIKSPDGILYYGHSIVYQDLLYVSGVKVENTKSDYDIDKFNPNKAPGVLLIYNKRTLKLVSQLEGFGYGPHELIIHKNEIVMAVSRDAQNKLSALVYLDLFSLKTIRTQPIDEKYKHLKFRHFMQTKDAFYPVLAAFDPKTDLVTNMAIGKFRKDQSLEIFDFSNTNEPKSDFDHTTSFVHDDNLHVVLYRVKRMMKLGKKADLVDFGQSDLNQLKHISNLVMRGENGFIFKDPQFNKDFEIKSHIYIS